MPNDAKEMPLCSSPLTHDEEIKLITLMDPLQRFLGSPGDWGYNTKLGRLTQFLHGLRTDIATQDNDVA